MLHKKETVEQLKTQLDEWNSKFKVLESKSNSIKTELKEKYNQNILAIKNELIEQKKKLNEFESASKDAVNELKIGIKAGWKNLETAFEQAYNSFK